MLTPAQIATSQEFHFGDCTLVVGARGGVRENVCRYRRASQTRYWKTRPNDFRFTVKYGMRSDTYAITPDNAHLFHVPADCPIRAH